jgi:hypothetical protein
MAGDNAGDLSDIIALLWRPRQGAAPPRSADGVAASPGTPHPLAAVLPQLWQVQVIRRDRCLPGVPRTDGGTQE